MSATEAGSVETLKPLKTWSFRAGQRKQPNEYEIVSVNTIFRANERDKVEMSPDAPVNRWYRKYQNESRLKHADWDAFRDPDAVTYRAYCTQRDRDEVYVDGLLAQHAGQQHDQGLSEAWVRQLADFYTPLRYLLHTGQMAAAYAVVMVPASTVVNCLAFQMGDQLRWVSRVSYRTAELRNTWADAGFGQQERASWEKAPQWQGYRELMERLLATYDFGEFLLALNLVAMPAIDAALTQIKECALENEDALTGFLIEAQLGDSNRRNKWTQRLMEFLATQPDNGAFAREVVERWAPLAERAVFAFAEALRTSRGEGARDAFKASLHPNSMPR